MVRYLKYKLISLTIFLSLLSISGASCDYQNIAECKEKGAVSEELDINLPGDRFAYQAVRIAEIPVEGDEDWESSEITVDQRFGVQPYQDISTTFQDGSDSLTTYWTGYGSIDVSGFPEGTYAATVWSCRYGSTPTNFGDCKYLQPWIFSISEREYELLGDIKEHETASGTYSPEFELDADAENVWLQLEKTDGNQEIETELSQREVEGEQGGGLYTSDIDVENNNLEGVYDASLVFRINGENKVIRDIQKIGFPYPKPEINAEINSGQIEVSANTPEGYDQIPIRSFVWFYDESGETIDTVSKTQECQSSCDFTFESPQEDIYASIVVNAERNMIEDDPLSTNEGEEARTTLTNQNPLVRRLSGIDDEKHEVVGSWTGEADITLIGGKVETAEQIYLTSNGQRVGETSVTEEGEVEITVQRSELPQGESELEIHILTGSGEAVESIPGTFEPQSIDEPPEIAPVEPRGTDLPIQVVDYAENQMEIRFGVRDKSSSTDLTIEIQGTDITEQCTIERGDSKSEAYEGICTIEKPVTEISKIDVEMTNQVGSSTTEDIGPIIFQPEKAIEDIDVEGNPSEKINIIIWGGPSIDQLDRSTVELAEDRVDSFFTTQDLEWLGDNFGSKFNFYALDSTEFCVHDLSSSERECDRVNAHSSALETSSMFNGGKIGNVVLSRSTRGFMAGRYVLAGRQSLSDGAEVFSHEIFHMVWGFADEYPSSASDQNGVLGTYFFSEDSSEYDFDKHTNLWLDRDNCEENVNRLYENLEPDNCNKIVEEGEDGDNSARFVIKKDGTNSLMASDGWTLYENHRERIRYLFEESSEYE